MAITSNNAIGGEICAALGLSHVTDCEISLHMDSVARVTVTYFPDEEHLRAGLKVIKKYKLVDVEPV